MRRVETTNDVDVESDDTDDHQSDSDDYNDGAISDDNRVVREKDARSHSPDERSQSNTPKLMTDIEGNEHDNIQHLNITHVSNKAAKPSSLEILAKVFPNQKSSVMLKALNECNGNVLQTIEKILSISRTGQMINEDKKRSNSNSDSEKHQEMSKKSSYGRKSPENFISPKDLSPKNRQFSYAASMNSINSIQQQQHQLQQLQQHSQQQPFFSIMPMTANNAGIPPPLVSASNHSGRRSSGVGSRSNTSQPPSQYMPPNMNLTSSFPRNMFGAMSSPYAGLFPAFPASAANLNFGLLTPNSAAIMQQQQHTVCPTSTSAYTITDAGMSPLEHLQSQVKRSSAQSMMGDNNEWIKNDNKHVSPSSISKKGLSEYSE